MSNVNPWVVAPETVRLDLEWRRGDAVLPLWLTVKRQLSVGEGRAMMRSVTSVTQEVAKARGDKAAPAMAKLEWTEYSFARMEAFILDWSLAHDADPANRLAPVKKSYEALHPAAFELIDEALDAHEKASADEGKAQAG